MTDLNQMLIEKITQLERRLKELERREFTKGGVSASSLTVEEEDLTPSVGSVAKIQVPNGTLTDDGGGTVSLGYAPSAQGVTNGNSHDHAGGDGAQVDHGGLGGLADDDHTQYLLAAGTRALTADWDAGSFEIRAQTLESDVITGTAPLTIASTTKVTNLNADQLDGKHDTDFSLASHTHTGRYVPVTATGLTDSAANSWGGGAARNTGTYTFRPEDNSNIWPSTAVAVEVFLYSQWGSANNTYIVSLRRSSGGTNEAQVRALVASVGYSNNVAIGLDASGYFYAVVEGANTAATTMRILGYYT